jgi:hypothetical protein
LAPIAGYFQVIALYCHGQMMGCPASLVCVLSATKWMVACPCLDALVLEAVDGDEGNLRHDVRYGHVALHPAYKAETL